MGDGPSALRRGDIQEQQKITLTKGGDRHGGVLSEMPRKARDEQLGIGDSEKRPSCHERRLPDLRDEVVPDWQVLESRRVHPAYQYMRDADDDSAVCQRQLRPRPGLRPNQGPQVDGVPGKADGGRVCERWRIREQGIADQQTEKHRSRDVRGIIPGII